MTSGGGPHSPGPTPARLGRSARLVVPLALVLGPARAETRVLPNGLRVVVAAEPVLAEAAHPSEDEPGTMDPAADAHRRDRGDQRVALHLRFEAGAAEDPPGLPGLAHLAEHAWFVGPEGAPPGAFDQALEAAGGEAGARTTHDATTIAVEVMSDGLERALTLVSERLAALGPPSPAGLEAQRGVVRAELLGEAEPVARLAALALYPPGHPYRRAPGGTPGAVASASAKEVVDFQSAWYGVQGATLAIVGAVEAEAVHAAVARHFAGIQPRSAPPRATGTPLVGERRRWAQGGPGLVVAWATGPAGDAAEPACDLLASLLGERLGATAWTTARRLGGELVVDLPVAGAGAAWAGLPLRPPAEALRRRLAEALRRVERAVAALGREAVDARTLQRHKDHWELGVRRQQAPLAARAAALARCAAAALPCPAEEIDRHQAVSAGEVRAAAADLARRPRAVLSRVGGLGAAAAIPGSEALEAP